MVNQTYIEVEKNRVERFRLEVIGMLVNGTSKREMAKRVAVSSKALSLWLKENNLAIKSKVTDITDSNTKGEMLPIYQIPSSLPKEFTVNKGGVLIIGQPGTGKSMLLNKLRSNWLNQGYKGISIDLGGSSKKIVDSLEGAVIESYSSKPNKISFNLFDIKAKKGEVFDSRELNYLQIPKYRLELLSKILKLFCLYGCDKDEAVELDKAEVEKLIKQVLELTYCKLSDKFVVVEDFISELRSVGETSELRLMAEAEVLANKVADKLESFVKETSTFCDWTNNHYEEKSLAVETIYKVFQIRYLSNSPNDLIRKVKLLYEVDKFLKINAFSKKFVDIDETTQLDRDPVLSLLSQIIHKTDINNGFPKTVVALVYQQYRDSLQSNFAKVIAATRNYIFRSWDVRELSYKRSKIAENLIIAHKNFSQCLFTDNRDGDVLLSIEYNQAEDTLLC